MRAEELIYDWNQGTSGSVADRKVQLVDETLRDGLQGGVPRMPVLEEKIELLALTQELGIEEATIGFPAQREAYQHMVDLCKMSVERGIDIRYGLLGRMVEPDIQAIARARDNSGARVTAWLFLGASPIRRYAEKWDRDRLETMARKSFRFARELDLPVNFGIEDSTRTEPEFVEALFQIAADEKVETVTICDTVGHLTPSGTRRMIGEYRRFLDDNQYDIQLDFHGHQDRGLSLANSLAAIETGAVRAHGTIQAIGERAGNCPLDLLLVNLKTMGFWQGDISQLHVYCSKLAEFCHSPVRAGYPVFGANAFRTQAGVHAAAIYKAELRGEIDIAAEVYSGVNPQMVGLDYDIEVGPASGRSNVRFVLLRMGIEEVSNEAVDRVLEIARGEKRILSHEEIRDLAMAEVGEPA